MNNSFVAIYLDFLLVYLHDYLYSNTSNDDDLNGENNKVIVVHFVHLKNIGEHSGSVFIDLMTDIH